MLILSFFGAPIFFREWLVTPCGIEGLQTFEDLCFSRGVSVVGGDLLRCCHGDFLCCLMFVMSYASFFGTSIGEDAFASFVASQHIVQCACAAICSFHWFRKSLFRHGFLCLVHMMYGSFFTVDRKFVFFFLANIEGTENGRSY